MTLYADLEIEPDATAEEIAAAHKAQAKRHHPDAGGNREDFERIQRAYVVLRDPDKRARYDKTGSADDAPDNEQAQRANRLVGAFDRAMSEGNADARDIIAAVIRILRDDLRKNAQAMIGARNELKIATKARKRLKFSGSGTNVLDRMLEDRIRQIDAAIAQMVREGEQLAAVIEMAREYKWEADAAPANWFYTAA